MEVGGDGVAGPQIGWMDRGKRPACTKATKKKKKASFFISSLSLSLFFVDEGKTRHGAQQQKEGKYCKWDGYGVVVVGGVACSFILSMVRLGQEEIDFLFLFFSFSFPNQKVGGRAEGGEGANHRDRKVDTKHG